MNTLVHSPAIQPLSLPRLLMQELRTDHAGEIGAVMIYRGILFVSKDQQIKDFAQHHLITEQKHLQLISQILPVNWQTALIPVWRIFGWLTGAIPAFFGPKAVYATIQAVETFVDQHYASQLVMIDRLQTQLQADKSDNKSTLQNAEALQNLRKLLVDCQSDEVEHREDARSRWDQDANAILRLWIWTVSKGSNVAVNICRNI